MSTQPRPRVVLLCHASDRIDAEGLAAWLASELDLVGIVAIADRGRRIVRAARREIRRVGWLRFLDVLAFRVFYRLTLARRDRAWMAAEVIRLRDRYPADLAEVPRLTVSSPNLPEVRAFLEDRQPDIVIARCKFLLRREIFSVPSTGTFVFHPGICPEYRNAHGCFWALARRDGARVGMTLLRIDEGVDTGPVFLQASYGFDELNDSHIVIQYRVVLENLAAIRDVLITLWRQGAVPMVTGGRSSAVWGQPWLTAYLRWKWAARRAAA
jgi:hypothetical protein